MSLAIIYPHSKEITLATLFVLVLAGLTKPHGLIILSIGLPAVLVRAWLANLRSEVALVILCSAIALIISSFVLISWIINPAYQPLNFEVAIMKEFLISGQVIEGVYSTYNSGTDRFSVRFWTMCERFLTFFSFFPVHWSNQHIALSSIFFIPSYLGIVFCWIRLAKNRLDAKLNGVVLLFTLWILGFATFAGWFDVSYEFRYRLPIMGLFAVGATLGLYAMGSRKLPITDVESSEQA